MAEYNKWVSCWGTATSITERREANYAKDITFRYPIKMCFNGSRIRLHFSNFTGTEDVVISKAFAGKTPLLLDGSVEIKIPAGKEIVTDEVDFAAVEGETVNISFYIKDYTQMNAGTLVTGPLSGGFYSYGDFSEAEELPDNLTKSTNWYYFLNTMDVFTEENNKAVCCFGDSITAQDWPDFFQTKLKERGIKNISVIRRAVCGTRILRQYDCITYQAYGLKGEIRFPVETNIAGLDSVIVQHGINDIIHPVGVEVNKFRPMTDMPSLEDLKNGIEKLYVDSCRKRRIKIYGGTLLPIYGWRTYAQFREDLRNEFNGWIRTCRNFDGFIDFDEAVRDRSSPEKFADGFDSGDHLHPSKAAYKAMAKAAADFIEKSMKK